jgi:hypothetical protein
MSTTCENKPPNSKPPNSKPPNSKPPNSKPPNNKHNVQLYCPNYLPGGGNINPKMIKFIEDEFTKVCMEEFRRLENEEKTISLEAL